MNAPKLIQSPLHPGWLIPEGWERILGIRMEYRLGNSVLHLWRVQWNQHVGGAPENGLHTHENHQLLYYRRGEGELVTEGECYRVGKGGIFVVPAGCLHRFLATHGEPALCLALDFTVAEGGTVDSWASQDEGAVLLSLIHADRARPFQLGLRDQAEVDGCIAAIVAENDRRELGYASMIHAHLIRLLSLCLRAIQRAQGFGEHFRHTAWRHALIAERAQALIRAEGVRQGTELTLTETARACATSPNQLNRILKHATGSTFGQILLRQRLEHAAELLREGKANCTEAAYAAGFNDSNYFSRAFRKVFGHAPSSLGKNGLV